MRRGRFATLISGRQVAVVVQTHDMAAGWGGVGLVLVCGGRHDSGTRGVIHLIYHLHAQCTESDGVEAGKLVLM